MDWGHIKEIVIDFAVERDALHIYFAFAVQVAAMGADDPVAKDRRLEEGEAPDVIEVEMAEQDVHFRGRVGSE